MEEERKNKCIYVQKSATQHTEKEMVRIVTLLQKYLDLLQANVAAVRDHKRVCDAECCLEQFTLFNLCRNSIIELLEAIATWQQGFTRVLRPILLECDYMIKLIKGAEFFNGTLLRRIFNFSLGKKNILFLPLPNPKTIEPVVVSPQLAEQIRQFAAPPMEKILSAYHILINSLPRNIYSKIIPLEEWLQNRWTPKIKCGTVTALADSQSKYIEAKRAKAESRERAIAAKKMAKSSGVSEFDVKMRQAKDRERRKTQKLLLSSKSASLLNGRNSPNGDDDNDNDDQEDEDVDEKEAADYFFASRLKRNTGINSTSSGIITGRSISNHVEEETVDSVPIVFYEQTEEEVLRLSSMFIPRDKLAMLDAVAEMDAVQSLSLSIAEGSTSLAPPDLQTGNGNEEGVAAAAVDGTPVLGSNLDAMDPNAVDSQQKPVRRTLYNKKRQQRQTVVEESLETLAAKMFGDDDDEMNDLREENDEDRQADNNNNNDIDNKEINAGTEIIEAEPAAAPQETVSPAAKQKKPLKSNSKPNSPNRNKLSGAPLSGAAGAALLRNKSHLPSQTTDSMKEEANPKSKGLLVSRLAALALAAEEAAVAAAVQASIATTKLTVEERAAKMSIRTGQFHHHAATKHHQEQELLRLQQQQQQQQQMQASNKNRATITAAIGSDDDDDGEEES